MTLRVLDQRMPKGGKWEGRKGRRWLGEGREAYQGQFLTLITESDRESGGVCIDKWVEGSVVSISGGKLM